MSNLTNKPVPFRTLSRDVLLMEKYHQTTYTRDKEGHLVVHDPAVSFPKVHDSMVTGYWKPLPGPAQSKKNAAWLVTEAMTIVVFIVVVTIG